MNTTNVSSTTNSTHGGGGSSSGSNGGGGGSGGGGPCGACKFLRRKCVSGCIFAPYFDSEQGAAHFAAVHKVFGASNVSKLLLHIPIHKRLDAVVTICYEAQARLRDPVYGCVAHIFALQQQVVNLQAELTYLQAHLATLELPTPPQPGPPHQALLIPPQTLSISDLPTVPNIINSTAVLPPSTYDLSSLFDPVSYPSWSNQAQRQQVDLRQFSTITRSTVSDQLPSSSASASAGGGDLQELARELLNRHAPPTVLCRNFHQGGCSTLPPDSSR